MTTVLTRESRVVAATRQVSSDLGNEAVILELGAGRYYGVNSVGAAVWKLVQQPQPVAAICDAVLARFDVPQEVCETDVLEFLRELQAASLIEVCDGAG